MTKKKAIEAALYCDCDEPGCSGRVWADIAAERAYNLGRIAGLRESRQFINPSYDTEADMVMDITDFANKLAKKARARLRHGNRKAGRKLIAGIIYSKPPKEPKR